MARALLCMQRRRAGRPPSCSLYSACTRVPPPPLLSPVRAPPRHLARPRTSHSASSASAPPAVTVPATRTPTRAPRAAHCERDRSRSATPPPPPRARARGPVQPCVARVARFRAQRELLLALLELLHAVVEPAGARTRRQDMAALGVRCVTVRSCVIVCVIVCVFACVIVCDCV